jgi:hypothetical protein
MGGFCRGDSFFFLTNVYLNVFGRVLMMCAYTFYQSSVGNVFGVHLWFQS